MMTGRKVKLFIAMSLDGFIAKTNGNLDFLSIVEQKGEDYGYAEFIKDVGTVILGRKTYDKVLTFGIPFPHADKQTYVITRTGRPAEGNITFYTGDLAALISKLKAETGKHIFVDGGADIINQMMGLNLIDEYIISIIPVCLGDGVPLFKHGRPESKLKLRSVKSFDKGLVQLHYAIS